MPTLDRSGQYRRDLGWKVTSLGRRTQQRFYLGRDEDGATLAEKRLEQFWSALERYWVGYRNGGCCLWEEWSIEIAKQIADGKMVVTVGLPANFRVVNADSGGLVSAHKGDDLEGLEAPASWLNVLKEYFGTICGFQITEEAVVEDFQAKRGQFYLNLGKDILATTGKPPTGETFHGAVDAYVAYLHRVHRTPEQAISQTGKKQGERAVRLKGHHPDFPLYDLTAKKIEEILFYWGKRPFHAKEKRYSRDTCKNQLILIRAFLRWMHRSDMEWQLPPAYLFPRIKIEWLPSEVSSEMKKRTFTMKQVALLWKHATPLERVFIALGINCGFGTAEIGTLAEAEINGSVIKRLRHKTKVFGAWWLFPITRNAIEWARKRKEVLGFTSDYLLVSDSGQPYSAVTVGNNNNQKIRNSWRRLIKRVRQEKDNTDFPNLSFGKLRKTAASWMRRVGGGEMSSIFIAHGKATDDSLLDLYADRQFRKLFKCQKRIWEKLKDVMTGDFPEPKPHKPTSHRHGDALKKRIQKLKRQGYKLTKIAQMTNTPLSTVSRIASAKTLDSDKTTGEQ